jgi:hypothetical protein
MQSIMFKTGNDYMCLACSRSLTLGRAIVMWCLLGNNFPVFDFLWLMDEKWMTKNIMLK